MNHLDPHNNPDPHTTSTPNANAQGLVGHQANLGKWAQSPNSQALKVVRHCGASSGGYGILSTHIGLIKQVDCVVSQTLMCAKPHH